MFSLTPVFDSHLQGVCYTNKGMDVLCMHFACVNIKLTVVAAGKPDIKDVFVTLRRAVRM